MTLLAESRSGAHEALQRSLAAQLTLRKVRFSR